MKGASKFYNYFVNFFGCNPSEDGKKYCSMRNTVAPVHCSQKLRVEIFFFWGGGMKGVSETTCLTLALL